MYCGISNYIIQQGVPSLFVLFSALKFSHNYFTLTLTYHWKILIVYRFLTDYIYLKSHKLLNNLSYIKFFDFIHCIFCICYTLYILFYNMVTWNDITAGPPKPLCTTYKKIFKLVKQQPRTSSALARTPNRLSF